MLRCVLLFILILVLQAGYSHYYEDYIWRRYTTEDGLSQNTVTSILQDRKGYMWFATWDGLSRFDGYNFRTYKVRPGDDVYITSSRIDQILEDRYGFIWLLVYGRNVCRFDPELEEFTNVPGYDSGGRQVINMVTLPKGVTWLITEEEGGIRVEPDSTSKALSYQHYSVKTGLLKSNYIHQVFEDADGNEWILTDNGISVIEGENGEITSYFFDSGDSGISNQQSFLSAYETGSEIWFGSVTGRIWRYEKAGGRFIHLQVPTTSDIVSIYPLTDRRFFLATSEDGFIIYHLSTNDSRHFPGQLPGSREDDVVTGTYQDRHGDVWIQQNSNYLLQYRPSSSRVVSHSVGSTVKDGAYHPNLMIHEDVNGILWVHPYGGGLYYYDNSIGSLQPFFAAEDALMTFSDRLHSMSSDRQGNLWMSTRAKGLERFVFPGNNFQLLEVNPQPHFFNDNDVRVIFQDSDERHWISTKAGQVGVFDRHKRLIGYLGLDGLLHPEARFDEGNVYTIEEDRYGNIWLGTKGNGLVKAEPVGDGGTLNYQLTWYKYRQDDLYSISHNDVYHIHEDGKGRLWIATYGGGINLVERNANGQFVFINHRNHLSSYPIHNCYRVRYITSCHGNRVWVGTTHGLLVFDDNFEGPETIRFQHYSYLPADSTCLSNNDVHDILITSSGDVYIATFGGGMNQLMGSPTDSVYRFKAYTSSDGLPTDVLLSLVEDHQGTIWIASENGLSQFYPDTGMFRNFNKTDFSRVLSFSEGPGHQSANGSVWFGTNNGVLTFYPDSIERSSYVPPIIFTEFRLLNKLIHPGNGNILTKHIDATDEIRLKHNQNIISFRFAAMDMKYPEAVKYEAMLDGFDDDWVYLDNQRTLNFTNLPHGHYTLRVRSTNSDGVWMDNEKSVRILISPSFWVTTWAYIIYFILFFSITGLLVYILFVIYRLRHRISLDQQVAEMKLDFFTNISHELRTPLTLITAPLEQVLNDSSLSEKARQSLLIIERSSSRMLRLINQLLDFVKINHNKMKMTVEMIPVAEFTNRVMDNFRLMAIDHQIDFYMEDESQGAYIWADADKLEKIIFNLLSNAFKFIDGGKFIKVRIENARENMIIKVIDNGIGIKENKKGSMFQRFENSLVKGNISQPSTGIGLSIVKELVEMHHGAITVENTGDRGTTFNIVLKKGREHFNENVEIIEEPENKIQLSESKDDKSGSDAQFSDEELDTSGQSTLLLVEDNLEVRRFIRDILSDDYHIIEAPDGLEGMDKAEKYLPDLIISDLMMPLKDGMELLSEIRANFNTSHIPFIMLTAKANEESQLKGLNKGADDYITKPFSPSYLKSRVENLLDQRRKLQLRFQGLVEGGKVDLAPSLPEVTSLDEKFLNDLKALMEQNMDNSSLVIDDLVREMALSRSVFFKKLKALTGMAPIEFIKDMRLKRAAQLIEVGQYNMTQISYMVGMNDSRYFSKCFKQKFGVTPSVYKSTLKHLHSSKSSSN